MGFNQALINLFQRFRRGTPGEQLVFQNLIFFDRKRNQVNIIGHQRLSPWFYSRSSKFTIKLGLRVLKNLLLNLLIFVLLELWMQ